MEKWIRRSEKGQVFLILMIGVTALLAFTALAIDTGQFYSDRRYDQNVADDSSLAGAGAAAKTLSASYVSYSNINCAHDGNYVYTDAGIQAAVTNAISEAQSRAFANHFDTLPPFNTEADLIAAGHGVWVECVEAGDPHLAVHVMITTHVQTAFAHMFFSSEFRNTVKAVSIAEGGIGLGSGMAIVALEEEGCGGQEGGLFFGGSTPVDVDAKVTIIGSGAHSNSCLVCEGSDVTIDADAPLSYNMGEEDTKCKEGSILGDPLVTPGDVIPAPPLVVLCGNGSYLSVSNVTNGNTLTLPPGNYKGITVNGGGSLILEPGLYCVEGSISISGGVIVTDDPSYPDNDDGVTIYSQSGDITINGSAEVNLRAPRSDPISGITPASLGYERPTIPGTLIYSDAEGKNLPAITLNGNENTKFRGTIYYPYGEVKIVGNSNNAEWYVEVIANMINISGNSAIRITYDPSNGHPGISSLTLER